MQNIIIIILAVFLIIVAKPNINESFIKLKKPLENIIPSNLEGRISELEKNYSAFNEKLSFITINNGEFTISSTLRVTGDINFVGDKGTLTIYNGYAVLKNNTNGCTIGIQNDSNPLSQCPWGLNWAGNRGWCDKRIKYNIQNANSNELLNKINMLPLQNYNFIDKKYYEGKTVYGLIAQDVKKILPEAVTIIKEYIPNINKIASFYEMNNKIILEVSNNTKTNDNIKLIINEMPFYTKVINSTYNSITVDKWPNYNDSDNVLVYGIMIDDFHTLNQSYLGVLSLGGIQELSKQMTYLYEENKKLKDKLEYLLNKY